MNWLITIAKLIAILAAAGVLGSWFLKDFKKAKLSGKPWYAPYLSPPGILLIIILILLPILAGLLQ